MGNEKKRGKQACYKLWKLVNSIDYFKNIITIKNHDTKNDIIRKKIIAFV